MRTCISTFICNGIVIVACKIGRRTCTSSSAKDYAEEAAKKSDGQRFVRCRRFAYHSLQICQTLFQFCDIASVGRIVRVSVVAGAGESREVRVAVGVPLRRGQQSSANQFADVRDKQLKREAERVGEKDSG